MAIDDLEGLSARYQELLKRVDDHTARVAEAHVDRMACRPGCAGCCRAGLTVAPIEAAAIERWLAEHPEPTDTDGTRVLTVLDEGREDCAWLGRDGRCRIYPARPLVCRSHGLPLLYERAGELHADVCPLNFDDADGLTTVATSEFLHQDTVHTILAALNQAWCAVAGRDPSEREPL